MRICPTRHLALKCLFVRKFKYSQNALALNREVYLFSLNLNLNLFSYLCVITRPKRTSACFGNPRFRVPTGTKTKHASRNSTTARACQTDSNRLRDRVFLLAVSHAGLKISPWRRFLLKLLRARESEYELWRFARSKFTRIPF